MIPVSKPMREFTILKVEHGGRGIFATSGWYVAMLPDEQSMTTRVPPRSPNASLAVKSSIWKDRHDVSNAVPRMKHRSIVVFCAIFMLPNRVIYLKNSKARYHFKRNRLVTGVWQGWCEWKRNRGTIMRHFHSASFRCRVRSRLEQSRWSYFVGVWSIRPPKMSAKMSAPTTCA